MDSMKKKKEYKLLIEGVVFYKKNYLNKKDEVFESIKTSSNLVLINGYNLVSESDMSNMILIKDYSENDDYRPTSRCCCF